MKGIICLMLLAFLLDFIYKRNGGETQDEQPQPRKIKRKPRQASLAIVEPEPSTVVVLMDGERKAPKLHVRTFDDDVLYVGGLAMIEGDDTFHTFQVLHFFEGGIVRLKRMDSRDNITQDVAIDKVRPVLYARD